MIHFGHPFVSNCNVWHKCDLHIRNHPVLRIFQMYVYKTKGAACEFRWKESFQELNQILRFWISFQSPLLAKLLQSRTSSLQSYITPVQTNSDRWGLKIKRMVGSATNRHFHDDNADISQLCKIHSFLFLNPRIGMKINVISSGNAKVYQNKNWNMSTPLKRSILSFIISLWSSFQISTQLQWRENNFQVSWIRKSDSAILSVDDMLVILLLLFPCLVCNMDVIKFLLSFITITIWNMLHIQICLKLVFSHLSLHEFYFQVQFQARLCPPFNF